MMDSIDSLLIEKSEETILIVITTDYFGIALECGIAVLMATHAVVNKYAKRSSERQDELTSGVMGLLTGLVNLLDLTFPSQGKM
jgi:hypothetical protein